MAASTSRSALLFFNTAVAILLPRALSMTTSQAIRALSCTSLERTRTMTRFEAFVKLDAALIGRGRRGDLAEGALGRLGEAGSRLPPLAVCQRVGREGHDAVALEADRRLPHGG